MTIDPLTEIVTLLQPRARFSKFVEGAGHWRVHRPALGEPFYCAVLEGRCRMIFGGKQTLVLEAGDFVLVPAMQDLVNESLEAPDDLEATAPTRLAEGHFRIGRQDGLPDMRAQIGHCQFGSPDAALLVSLLPDIVVVRAEPRLATLMELVNDETRAGRQARELVLERLLEVLLIEALRSGAAGSGAPGLTRGLADERLAPALHALHARPDHAWTVTELAGEAALSRSAFFARFSRIVGIAPMEYLLAWRMALAKRLLRDDGSTVQEIAERVGYGSASTFTTAFSRHTGMPPARYARLNGRNSAEDMFPPSELATEQVAF
ncbi:AraC family transcriptional regulator [Rhizobium halophytocola]|uniref:AraC-like DNA-binding protein n=1 Tax=Rhizobium halophytocola TaxID=735519 RepID=A0ABS4DSW1_9HYPH|nr:AraC family transcriptional regulator [Rhizobium halophytocola]MBP1848769.1 AraC-like DNA-binding protein [Rhizobium halophytocola]